MPLMRNPFRSRPNDQAHDEFGRPIVERPDSGAGKGDNWNLKTKPMSIRTNSSTNSDFRPTEYKMSEINDSGVYMPPSPTEKKPPVWSTRSATSTRSSSTFNDNAPFNISRESFDSYRRSFDISARSPIMTGTSPRPRQSLDVRAMRAPPSATSASPIQRPSQRSSTDHPHRRPSATPYQPRPTILPDNFVHPPTSQPEESEDVESQSSVSPSTSAATGEASVSTNPSTPPDSVEDRFEDVRLQDPTTAGQSEYPAKKQQSMQPPKKPSIFARFGTSSEAGIPHKDDLAVNRPNSSGLGIGLGMFGRKRGTSGQEAELGHIQQPQQHQGKKGSLSSVGASTDNKSDV